MSMRPYVVRRGDTLASIAAAKGLDRNDIWGHPENARLVEQRGDPAILLPGDVLFLPMAKRRWLPVTIGAVNTFVATLATETVRFVVGAPDPLANEPYIISGLPAAIEGTTSADGSLSVEVPVTQRSFVLHLPRRNVSHPVFVGHLDPADSDSGVRQRLSNLGYASTLASYHEPFGVILAPGSEHQVRLFQSASGLEPSGNVDSATTAALTKAHGI